jgi:hypothetical protein
MILIGLFSFSVKATNINNVDTSIVQDTVCLKIENREKVQIICQHKDGIPREKLVSAILAFPFPFGFMGAHRVMLGTKPWVPVVYVATFGGCFGLLPLIDFFVITFSKDVKQYENNPNVFMWIK